MAAINRQQRRWQEKSGNYLLNKALAKVYRTKMFDGKAEGKHRLNDKIKTTQH